MEPADSPGPSGACTGARQRSAGRLTDVCVHRTTTLEAADVRTRDGLPVTSPLRTVLDKAPLLSGRTLELLLDQAIVAHLLNDRELRHLRERCVSRPGCGELKRLIDTWNGPTITRSEAEEIFLALIRQAKLPAPQVNRRWRGRERDFHWPDARLMVEVDGWEFHRTRRVFEDEHRRDGTTWAVGVGTMRITARQLTDEPMAVIARLAAALALASAGPTPAMTTPPSARSSPGPWSPARR